MSNIPEYSVSEISYLIKKKLEHDFSYIQVKGEISDLKIWNGHFLFNLKDNDGTIASRIWKNKVSLLNFKPEEGLEITATGRVSTHPKRSGYNLIIDNINATGEGELLKLIENRKKKLKESGIFEKCASLPFLPLNIGVITSLTGAVIEDIKNKISKRFPSNLLIWPVSVQGITAEKDIINAIKGMNSIKKGNIPEVIILARGGGSVEDLMPFNSEKLAYEIYNSNIPIVSAIGHETDFTIADFAADHRASTPTAAADMVIPEKKELEMKIIELSKNINLSINRIAADANAKINQTSLRLINLRRLINNNEEKILNQHNYLNKLIKFKLLEKENNFKSMKFRTPKFLFQKLDTYTNKLNENLNKSILNLIKQKKDISKSRFQLLVSNSYEKWLAKGFTLVKNKEKKIIKNINQISINEELNIHFYKGKVNAKVKNIKKF